MDKKNELSLIFFLQICIKQVGWSIYKSILGRPGHNLVVVWLWFQQDGQYLNSVPSPYSNQTPQINLMYHLRNEKLIRRKFYNTKLCTYTKDGSLCYLLAIRILSTSFEIVQHLNAFWNLSSYANFKT